MTSTTDRGRRLVALDRGFIFVGHLIEGEDGMSHLTDVHNVRYWASGGLGGMLLDPKRCEAALDACADIDFRTGSELWTSEVGKEWGL